MGIFDYAPAPESRAIVDIRPSYGLFIGGEFVPATGGAFKRVNPATEEVLAEIAEASAMRTWTAPWPPRVRPMSRSGPGCRAASGPSTCSGSPG